MQNQHGQFRVRQHFGGLTTDEKTLHAVPSMRSHHNAVTALVSAVLIMAS